MSVPHNTDGSPKPLNLKIPPDLDNWRLGDIALFESGGFSFRGFMAFMQKHSDWSLTEIEDLTRAEMMEIVPQIAKQIELTAVPKASAASS